jgi:exonuclease VII small subunit
MEHYEMAELLSQKAHVSLEQARQALIDNNWDILDAMVALERQGAGPIPTVEVDADTSYTDAEYTQPVKNIAKKEPIFTNGFAQLWKYIKRLGQMSVDNDFVVIRRDKTLLSMPVLALAALLVLCFWFTLPLLVVGLFCGCQYRFEGKSSVKNAVNKAMEKLDGVADHIKQALNEDDEQR